MLTIKHLTRNKRFLAVFGGIEQPMGASGERGRLARGVWRPAKHTLVRCPVARDDTLGIHSLKTLGGEKRGEVRRETHRTASETLALPNHSSGFRRSTENSEEPNKTRNKPSREP